MSVSSPQRVFMISVEGTILRVDDSFWFGRCLWHELPWGYFHWGGLPFCHFSLHSLVSY